MPTAEVTSAEVAALLRAAAPFPVEALTDPDKADAYLAAIRSRVYPQDGPTRYPVDAVREVEVSPRVRVRTYVPARHGLSPIVVYLHGGGWVMGSLDQHDLTCRVLANAVGAAVVNVDYRLAPEHPYPAPLDDCAEAVRWAVAHAADLGADETRLVVAGSSAGGNLAAGLARRARSGALPAIALQVLINPVLDSSLSSASMSQFGTGYFLEREQVRFFWNSYLAGGASPHDPEVSPAHTNSLAGLCPALVVTCELDPLRDEGEAYARRLSAQGVAVRLLRVPGQVHGFLGMFDTFTEAEERLLEIAAMIRAVVGPPTRTGSGQR